VQELTSSSPHTRERAAVIFQTHEQRIYERTDRMFAGLMALQWLAGILAALTISPLTWSGTYSETHIHVWAAVFLGGAISIFPILCALLLPGATLTRHVVAAGQMLTSALLIHLTGGRIETHFHVFGSLAFLAFYRDWRVLITASAIVAVDHLLRGLFWPQSVYGVLAVEPWRWLEHAGWVIFEDVFLIISTLQSRKAMATIADRQADLETVNEAIEQQVLDRTVELRESEAALRLALEKAKESERLKTDFLASMSHEIRTPLNGVIGMTGLLIDTPLTPEQREYGETVRNSADTLLGLINDILDFSKIEAGRLSIEPIPFDLEVAAEEVVELLASKASEKNLNLVLRYAPDTPSRVIGDPGRVRQILTNLVANAVKFTDKGHVFVNIEIQRQDGGVGQFRFSVEDTGIGIGEETQQHIFERFTQADTSTTRKYGGTGLGLAICRELVHLMGGEISVRSQMGRGSTFWFMLPLSLDSAREPIPAPVVSDLMDVRVLIVDDNEVNRRVYHELITRWGMRNGAFASAAEALSALREARTQGDPFQMALVDLNMPEVDGEMLGRAIKADPRIRDTVLLLLTSSGQKGDSKRMAEAGFAAYLTKPVRPSMLMDALATAWAGRDRRKEAVLITRHSLAEREYAAVRETEDSPTVRARVLLVEDNVVNQKVARLILEKLGCRVDVAANGKEAVDLAQAIPYDVIFMDCQMPEMDGYEATREIRHLGKDGARVPIIAMTAHALRGDRERCLDAGMDDHVSKPVRRETVKEALQKWLAGRTPASAAPCPDRENGVDPEMAANLHNIREEAGEDFVTELVADFLENTHASLDALREALKRGDRQKAAEIMHTMKGSTATLGAMRLARLCREVEEAMRNGAAGMNLVTPLEDEFRALERSIATFRAAGAAEPERPTA